MNNRNPMMNNRNPMMNNRNPMMNNRNPMMNNIIPNDEMMVFINGDTLNQDKNIFSSIFRDIFPKKVVKKDEPIKSLVFDENKEYNILENKMETLDDLIKLGKLYNDKSEDNYSFDIKSLYNLVEPMEELNNLIGLEKVKKSITEFIIYNIQRLEDQKTEMYHTVIQGPPGVGKTELGKILCKIYNKLGIINNDKFKIVKRSDLIGKYLGHTAVQTQKVIDECEGGVLFIDEAYSLGNEEGKDSYSKECIDTLNQNLSEKKFICIIAGYKDSLEKCFFSLNEGLNRRFSFRYTIDGYSPLELSHIFIKKAKDINYNIDDKMFKDNKLEKFFKENKDNFKNYGGDMETLLLNCKITHSNRIFGKHPKYRKKINKDDIYNGFKRFLLHRKIDKNDRYKYDMYT
jgi:SpoVK/Ycf46/Vps4 family AAA+-type ATPase